jgi:uncharacterized protein YprB with RNaseH-like and TPR domain
MDHRRLRDRLARHRAGAVQVEPTASSAVAEPEVDWHARIGHLRQLIQARRRRLVSADSPPLLPLATSAYPIAGRVTSLALAGSPQALDPASLGASVGEGVRLIDERLEVSASLPAPGSASTDPVLCFDTETTGLRGGAGMWVWMVGLLIWRDGHWRLRQWWLERPGAERAYLELLLADFSDGPITLVSFNGKSFDLPHLATRLGLSGLHNPLPELPHIDLLHALRRRHGKEWSDCRLRTAEERLLDLHRDDDLPGSEAPRSWREYLTEGRWHGIAQVLAHNRQDLLTLARLLPLLGEPEPFNTKGTKGSGPRGQKSRAEGSGCRGRES